MLAGGKCERRGPDTRGAATDQRRGVRVPPVERPGQTHVMRVGCDEDKANRHERGRRRLRGQDPENQRGSQREGGREQPRTDPATATFEPRHHAPCHRGYRHDAAIDGREQTQRLFPFRAQLGRQGGERDVAVEQLLHQRMKLVLAHLCSRS